MVSREGILGIGWGTIILVALVFLVDHQYNHGQIASALGSMISGLFGHPDVTVKHGG